MILMSKERKGGFGKFLCGAALGAGIALLFAPDKGSVTRKKLKVKLDEVLEYVKNIDKEEVKAEIVSRVNELKDELADLDKEKVLEIAKDQANKIQKKAEELYKYAVKKGTPVLQDVTNEVRLRALQVAKSVVVKLEKDEPVKEVKKTVKKTTKK